MVIAKGCRFSDVYAVKGKLRRSDREELFAATGDLPEEVLIESFRSSIKSWSILHNEKPVAVYGVAPYPGVSGVGVPWLLGTDGMCKRVVQIALLRQSKQYVKRMLDVFPYLINFVDARNKMSIRWLRWCGFTIRPAQPYGPFNLPFHRFDMGV
jgi:hypothetical protein